MQTIANLIDHTLLKPEATKETIERLCSEAKEYKFFSVCVNPYYVALAKRLLHDSDVKIATVIGFPLGATTKEVKSFEAENAVENGADEVDMVINVGALKNENYNIVRDDIKEVVESVNGKALVKVIIETCLLTDGEKIKACELAREAGAGFVKTSTGFNTGGATVEDIKLIKETVKDNLKIKASGGIRNYEKAKAIVEAGADRIGASASVRIVKDENK